MLFTHLYLSREWRKNFLVNMTFDFKIMYFNSCKASDMQLIDFVAFSCLQNSSQLVDSGKHIEF